MMSVKITNGRTGVTLSWECHVIGEDFLRTNYPGCRTDVLTRSDGAIISPERSEKLTFRLDVGASYVVPPVDDGEKSASSSDWQRAPDVSPYLHSTEDGLRALQTVSTERAKMIAGEPYMAWEPALVAERRRARFFVHAFNSCLEEATRQSIIARLFGRCGKNVYVEPPFSCDYGTLISVGDNTYFNFGAVILDCNAVTIGRNCKFGPGVHIYAAAHPTDAAERDRLVEFSRPVTIGDSCWIGGSTVILPGVTIGDRVTIGAGSVVVRSIPSDTVAVGNPARVVKHLKAPV